MRSGSRLLQRYIAAAVIPYILLAFLLLTAILLAQQSTRFAEILVTSRVPLSLFADVTAALIPNVIVLTLPIAVLTGTVVGFSRLGSDSEMVAIRNAGLSTWRVLWPVLLVGVVGTACAAYVNFDAAPQSAGLLRQAGLQAALTKLNSPIDPRSFNLDMPGYVIYVRDGDKIKGEWGRIFIYSKEKNGGNYVVTAKTGRMDTTGDQSELVLTDAVATTLPASDNKENKSKFTVEHLETLRVGLDTGRKPLMEKLRQAGDDPDEADIGKLLKMVHSSDAKEKKEAIVLLHKRITLALSPLLFSLLGAAIGLRVRKGGRALGVFLSIVCTLGYYMAALIGDQMARAGTVPVVLGLWLATIATLFCSLILLWLSPGRALPRISFQSLLFNSGTPRKPVPSVLIKTRTLFSGFPSLLDSGVLKSLGTAFVVSVSALTGLVAIFTVFELWRYITTTQGGFVLIGQYLVFLLPFVLIQVIPAATLLAVLSTYALMARRSEHIAWWASGQSVFRLFLPGILFSVVIGCGTWYLQEKITPKANIRQDALRSQLKKQVPRTITSTGRQWLASLDSQRLYSFDYANHESQVEAMALFEFDGSGTHLSRIVRADSAVWLGNENIKLANAEVFRFTNQKVSYEHAPEMQIPQVEKFALFKPTIDKPSQLNAKQLSEYIKLNKQRGVDVAGMLVALYRKYAEPFGAIVMMMLGAPLALSFGRKNVVAGLCMAILVGIAFWAASGGFQQLGSLGLLPAAVAAIAPFAIFGSVGLYLLSRTRT